MPSPLCCPFGEEIHPLATEINQLTLEWLDRYDLYEDESSRPRYQRLQPGMLVARVIAPAQFDRALPIADFHSWLFAFDDAYSDENERGGRPARLAADLAQMLRLLDTPTSPILPTNRYARALVDLRLRLDHIATPRQLQRWQEAMRSYFFHLLWEAGNRSSHTVPSLSEYALLRIYNGAMLPSIMLLDVAEGFELPAEEFDRPDVRALIEMTATIVGWDNDLFSYGKESALPGAGLLEVIAREHGCDIQHAAEIALAYRDRILLRYLAVRDATLPTAAPPLRRFVAALDRWIHSNIEFSRTCARYLDGGTRLDVVCGVAPPFSGSDALPVASVQWWWEPTAQQSSPTASAPSPAADGAVAESILAHTTSQITPVMR